MKTVIYWFRQDLRLHDQRVLFDLCRSPAIRLLPVYCLPDTAATTRWGFCRLGPHRRHWLAAALSGLSVSLREQGTSLHVLSGPLVTALTGLARESGASTIIAEQIAAPEEIANVNALRTRGLTVNLHWQSSLLDPDTLPWPPTHLPAVFTPFRQKLEAYGCQPRAPQPAPTDWLAAKAEGPGDAAITTLCTGLSAHSGHDPRSAFPYGLPDYHGSEAAGLAHAARYLTRKLPITYKQTRDALSGTDDSSKWSPWLATGAVSARKLLAELRIFEQQHGVSEGSNWLWFELLWRDYFRFLHLCHGATLYRARGLTQSAAAPPHDANAFSAWCDGRTGNPLIDAGMRELATTGFLSNRMRQICASYLIHELACDWRAGAAWFEAQLLDYDVYSNQGNWLYIAGRGTDPRGGRHFDTTRQAARFDPDGHYQQRWQTL